MIEALITKEWIKSRYAIYASVAAMFVALGHIYFSIGAMLEHNTPSIVLLRIVQNQGLDIDTFLYLLPLSGFFLAFVQFRPEKESARLRLHLHLPLKRSFLVNFFLLYGVGVIIVFFLLSVTLLFLIITHFFTIEVFYALMSKVFAFGCLSLLVYFGLSIFIINPLLKVKISIVVLSLALAQIYFSYTQNYFVGENLYYYFGVILLVYYSGYLRSFDIYTQGYTK